MFSGAATPASGPARCRDPAAIFYRENASCQITSTIESFYCTTYDDVMCCFSFFLQPLLNLRTIPMLSMKVLATIKSV